MHGKILQSLKNTLKPLYDAICEADIFSDFKAFADSEPLYHPEEIISKFRSERSKIDFNLNYFINANFKFRKDKEVTFITDKSLSISDHIKNLWPFLTKNDEYDSSHSNLIKLPKPYIVPGGRFNEIYYWDSYFTMLGLEAEQNYVMIENMTDNFKELILKYNFIPNGNRKYYLSRSQPPFYVFMVKIMEKIKGIDFVIEKYLDTLITEYNFWMQSSKTVQIEGYILNIYKDNLNEPRTEMYSDDIKLFHTINHQNPILYQDIRSACESGWDFSSRWFANCKDLASIHTTEIIPIDLNSLLYVLELYLHELFSVRDGSKDKYYLNKSGVRKKSINEILWNNNENMYQDYNHKSGNFTGVISAAISFPLFAEIADDLKAKFTMKTLKDVLLKEGGVVTTNNHTGQQWDAPNGWAPLQWIAYVGCKNYYNFELANTIRKRWLSLNEKIFKETGKMLEKYNVEDINLEGGGGEYPVQDGFGWTNGVFLALTNDDELNH